MCFFTVNRVLPEEEEQAAEAEEKAEEEVSSWSGDISLTGGYQYGNTESKSSAISGESLFSRDKNQFESKARSYFASDDTGIIARNSSISAKYDRLISDTFSLYINQGLLNDRFKDLELRSTTGAGAAYRIWNDEKKKFVVELGAAYITEDHILYENWEETTGRAAAKIEVKGGAGIVFKDSFEAFPSFEQSGEFIMLNQCTVISALGAGLALKLEHILQHDTDPPPGIRKTDVTLSLGIQYSF